jgi:hypothetical protein
LLFFINKKAKKKVGRGQPLLFHQKTLQSCELNLLGSNLMGVEPPPSLESK